MPMKTLINENMKRALGLVVAAVSIAALAACSKSGGTSLSDRFARGQSTAGNNNYYTMANGQSVSGWGCIFNNSVNTFNQVLTGPQGFMPVVTDLGQVSSSQASCQGNSTGIVFAGSITASAGAGQIEMVIEDPECLQSNGTQCYAPIFTVSQGMSVSGGGQTYQTVVNQSGAQVVGEDNYGAIIFNGTFTNNYWEGNVYWANNSNAQSTSGTLGQFMIPVNYVFH